MALRITRRSNCEGNVNNYRPENSMTLLLTHNMSISRRPTRRSGPRFPERQPWQSSATRTRGSVSSVLAIRHKTRCYSCSIVSTCDLPYRIRSTISTEYFKRDSSNKAPSPYCLPCWGSWGSTSFSYKILQRSCPIIPHRFLSALDYPPGSSHRRWRCCNVVTPVAIPAY